MRPSLRRLAIHAAGTALAASLFSCDRLPAGPADDGSLRVRGVTLAEWSAEGYRSAGAALDRIRDTGTNTVVLIRTAYQSDVRDSAIRIDSRTPTIAALEEAAAMSAARGMAVAVKPHVDLDGGDWRGNISPADPGTWFDSYGDFVLECARLAERVGAVQFVVGTELEGTIGHSERWRALIARVRSEYHGEVVYASTWDGARRVTFWDAVDLVGVDFYGPVTRRRDPGRLEILAGWQPWLERLQILHRLAGRPLLLTEIGYRSVDGAGMDPFRFGDDRTVDTGEQADLYWAALEAVGLLECVRGVYWWNWLADDEGGPDNDDYTPSGKPAEEVLRDAWR